MKLAKEVLHMTAEALKDPLDDVLVFDKNKKPMSIYQLCQGDLIEVTFNNGEGTAEATLRGLFVRRKVGILIGLQTALAFHPIYIDNIVKIEVLHPFFD